MLWFNRDNETLKNNKRKYFEIMEELKGKEKPDLKDLVALMLAQYAIIFPMVFIGLGIFAFILYIFMAWIN